MYFKAANKSAIQLGNNLPEGTERYTVLELDPPKQNKNRNIRLAVFCLILLLSFSSMLLYIKNLVCRTDEL